MTKSPAAEPRRSFDGAAEIYHGIRPNYPAPMFEDLFRLLPSHPAILEVGPGTGQATRDLLSRGAIVHAIEIGPAMAAKLRGALPSPALTITIGDFEEVDVEEHGFDAVFSATAYHWISPKAQVDRPVSVLKPGGVVAIVDLNQVSSPDDKGFFAAAQPIYERYGEGHAGSRAPERNAVDPPVSPRATRRPAVLERRGSYLRLEPDLQCSRLSQADALLLQHADDDAASQAGTARRHGGFCPATVRQSGHQADRRHVDHRESDLMPTTGALCLVPGAGWLPVGEWDDPAAGVRVAELLVSRVS